MAGTTDRTASAANVWFCRCRFAELAGDLVFRREQPADAAKCEDCGAENERLRSPSPVLEAEDDWPVVTESFDLWPGDFR